MKMLMSISAIALLAVLTAGCQGVPQTKVLRVGMQDGTSNWLVSVNSNKPRLYPSSPDLCNYLTRLQLQRGDLIVLKDRPVAESAHIVDFLSGITSYCASNRVAVYLYRGQYPSTELFSVPIYNWTAPFNNPRKLSAAMFFDDGRFLGVGRDGFDKMVRSIGQIKAPKVLILGSLYNMDSQFGPFERPYEVQQSVLDQVLKKNGTELVILNPL
jgi:hypothetical protein